MQPSDTVTYGRRVIDQHPVIDDRLVRVRLLLPFLFETNIERSLELI